MKFASSHLSRRCQLWLLQDDKMSVCGTFTCSNAMFGTQKTVIWTLCKGVELGLGENGVLRILSEPRRGDATEWWRKVRTGELDSIHSLANIISMIKSGAKKWEWQIVRMGEQCTKLPSDKQEGKMSFEKNSACTGGLQWNLAFWRRNYFFNFSTLCL